MVGAWRTGVPFCTALRRHGCCHKRRLDQRVSVFNIQAKLCSSSSGTAEQAEALLPADLVFCANL